MQLQNEKKVWAVISNRGNVWALSISRSKKGAIRKFVECIPEPWQETWTESVRRGYVCKRINVIYEIDETYNKKKQL